MSWAALALAAVAGQAAERGLLDGGFTQMSDMRKLSAEDWTRELEAMRAVGMRLVVIQWTMLDERRLFDEPDPFPAFLQAAANSQMRVFLGLRGDRKWWNSWGDADYLKTTAARDAALARQLQERYGEQPAFRGYYVPHEIWAGPFTEEQLHALYAFYHYMSPYRGDRQKSLYEGYRTLARDRESVAKWPAAASQSQRQPVRASQACSGSIICRLRA